MNIAFVSDAIWPYNKGGKEKRIFEISTRLVKRGHNVHVYTMHWWTGNESERIEEGVHLHAISKRYPLYAGKRRSIKEAILFSLACFKLFGKKFDVLEADHMPHLVLFPLKIVCLLKKKKLIAVWNEVWGRNYWVSYMGVFGNAAYGIEKLSILMPDAIVSISPHTSDKLRNVLDSKKEIVTVPMGIDYKSIQFVTPAKKTSDIIFAGRLLSHKNVDVLIKSVRTLTKTFPDIVCYIVGEGPEKNRLISLTNKLGLEKNIRFFDFFNRHADLLALMKSSKVFVLPSTREGFGIVVVEANACGIPVIAINHRNNAAKDLIMDGENGYLCDLDENEIAKNITSILKNGIDRKAKQICIDSAKNNDWNNIVNMIDGIYIL